MAKFWTKDQIAECRYYLHYCVKEGAMEWDEAIKIQKLCEATGNWKPVYDIMDRADAYADAMRKGE